MSGDLHIIGTANGVFVTRSIRRNASPFNLSRLGDIENWPWEFGYAALGNRLVYNKRVTQPIAFGVGAAVPPQIDVDAIHKLSSMHWLIHMKMSSMKLRRGALQNHLSLWKFQKLQKLQQMPQLQRQAVHVDAHGQKRLDETDDVDSHKRVKFADAGFSLLEETFLLDDSITGQQLLRLQTQMMTQTSNASIK